jgi:hypothetical protein
MQAVGEILSHGLGWRLFSHPASAG